MKKIYLFAGVILSVLIISNSMMNVIARDVRDVPLSLSIKGAEPIFFEEECSETILIDSMQPGDLLFMDGQPEFDQEPDLPVDHVALYMGDGWFIESSNYLEVLGGSDYFDGVQRHYYTFYYLWAEDFQVGRVKDVTTSQINAAISWAQSKLQDSYEWDYFDLDGDEWSCSELVWAAYAHQGIRTIEKSFCCYYNDYVLPDWFPTQEDIENCPNDVCTLCFEDDWVWVIKECAFLLSLSSYIELLDSTSLIQKFPQLMVLWNLELK